MLLITIRCLKNCLIFEKVIKNKKLTQTKYLHEKIPKKYKKSQNVKKNQKKLYKLKNHFTLTSVRVRLETGTTSSPRAWSAAEC